MQGLYSGRIFDNLEICYFMLTLFPYYHGVDVILDLQDIINMHYNLIHWWKKDKKNDFNGWRAWCFQKTLVAAHFSCTDKAHGASAGYRQSAYGDYVSTL